MSNNTKNRVNDSQLFDVGRMAIPSSDNLQKKILKTTKTMPQEPVIGEQVIVSKTNSKKWFSRHATPVALAAILMLGMVMWFPAQQLTQRNANYDQFTSLPEVNEFEAKSDEAPLSADDLELYELLLIEDELILAQF